MPTLKRVCAYARVSSGKDAMLHSLAAQVSYYSDFIQHHPEWQYAGVYADEALTGTKGSRPEFVRLIDDCKSGLIDLVITKSISRFARNTVDLLNTVRELKELGVDVYFEEQNIHTRSGDGELMLTILASYAQEESRSASENCLWRIRERFKKGEPVGFFTMFGYRFVNDEMVVYEEEAVIVRMIFDDYISGLGGRKIAMKLREMNVPTVFGGKWSADRVAALIKNEKFTGDSLLQKGFTVDFLTKKQKVNEGEVPHYYVQNSHPAIILPDEFDAVQSEIERRKQTASPCRCGSPFSGKIICGECGGIFGSKVWHSTDEYRRTIWRCNEKYKGESKCGTPHVTEDEVKAAFLIAFNKLMEGRDELVTDCRIAQSILCDTTAIDTELDELRREIEVVAELSRKAIYENARIAQDQEEWMERNNAYLERHQRATDRACELEDLLRERQAKKRTLDAFISELESRPQEIMEFDERLWAVAVDTVTIMKDGSMVFRFKDGTEI
jgi:DNA invertase Pin-like site-specific DNA recombinase